MDISTSTDIQDPTRTSLSTVEGRRTPPQESWCRQVLRRLFPTGYCWEFKGTMSIAWALILTQASQILFQPVAVMFGGHLGKLELDAIALSNTLINVLGNSIAIGFATCLDTVFSQAFGNRNYKMLGNYLQTGLILHFLLLMPCYAIHLNIKPILIGLGQQEDVVELTAQYMLYFMPGMFFLFIWTALKKFTQCQNAVTPHIIINLIGHGVHALLQYLLLYQFNFGITGSSIAQASTFGVMCILTIIYTICSKEYKLCWNGWSRCCMLDWGVLSWLGMFGMLMTCLEWWAFEASILLAGSMGDTELGAQSVTFNLEIMSFGVPTGIALATSIRVGQFLGAARKEAAICAVRVGMTVTAVNALIWAIVFLGAKSELPKMFTNDVETIELVSQLMPFVAGFIFFDAISVIGRGVFRGTGKQKWGTVIIFFAYYMVALPLAIPLTLLTPLQIKGIWVGFIVSLFLCALIYFTFINFGLNWDKLEKEALERVSGTKQHVTKFDDDDEKKPLLLGGSLSVSGLMTDTVYIPQSLYIKRAATITFFILLPIVGLIIRLVTQTGTTTHPAPVYNSTLINTTQLFTASTTDTTKPLSNIPEAFTLPW